jgi:hypothetical protein
MKVFLGWSGDTSHKVGLGGVAEAFTTHKSGCPALLAFVARGRGF